jgi:uncharacterized protein
VESFSFKVIVAGPFAAGKTTFINHISQTTVVGTEEPTSRDEASVKATTTVGMEYGTFTVTSDELQVDLRLYGVPGQERFRFMWDIVSEGMDALLVLVDGTNADSWPDAASISHHLHDVSKPPTIVAINKADLAPPGAIDQVRAVIGLDDAAYAPCDILDELSARTTLIALLTMLLARLEDSGDEMATAQDAP